MGIDVRRRGGGPAPRRARRPGPGRPPVALVAALVAVAVVVVGRFVVDPPGVRPAGVQLAGARPADVRPADVRPADVRPTDVRPANTRSTGERVAVIPRPVTLAFAGDVHFEGSSAVALDDGLGTAAEVLRSADLAVVNLETAVTGGGVRQPKQYAFRAPARAFAVLADAGVDAVSMANNHAMDYGRVGLVDSLAAADAAGVAVVGAGADVAAAFAPERRTIRGVKVSVFGVTDVLDSFAVRSWPAAPRRPGLASAQGAGLTRLADAVRAEKADRGGVVAVMVHWGVERAACPTARQREVAQALADAGADAVVGSHAHVLQPQVTIGRTLVAYGLGNFVFYAKGGPALQSGVLTVTVSGAGVLDSDWAPAVIRAGRPGLLTGVEKAAAVRAQEERGAGCAVA